MLNPFFSPSPAARPHNGLCGRLLPSDYPRAPHPVLECAGIATLLLTVFLFLWARDWARVFEVLFLFATIVSAVQILRNDPDAWVYLVLILVVLWTITINRLSMQWYPQWDGDKLEGTRDSARMFLFALCGWWLGGRPRSIAVIACVAIGGALVASAIPALGIPWEDEAEGSPNAFGFRNSQHAAVIYGTILLVAIVLVPRFCRGTRAAQLVRWTICALIIIGCLWILNQTGNRQVWLGLISGLGVAGVIFLRRASTYDSDTRLGGHRRGAAWLAVVLAVAAMVWSAGPAWERMQREWNEVSEYMTGEAAMPKPTSALIRLELWKSTVAAISERPLLGYGGANRQHVIPESGLPESMEQWGHAHNSYLDLAVEYGIVVPILFISILSGLALRVIQAWRQRFLPTDVAALLLGWIAFFAVVNVFESYVYYDTGILLMMVMGGVCYTATIPYRRSRRGPHSVAERQPV